jgi:serine/threonine protein phosphatase PrpC
MLRVAEQYAGTDTGLQRRANEDSLLARAPLFVVADGMGGAQAGEVASKIAVESFHAGLAPDTSPKEGLVAYALAANARIHALSRTNAEQAGMGTTLTAVYVGEDDVVIAHVGDSRAYCLREGALLRLTDDHSLVDELIREGRLTPEEAEEHPQRSIITRALGPEEVVEVDTRSFRGRAGDLYLLCSDGLTSMVAEARVAEILRAYSHARLREAGEALIAEANRAGGRDNVTVILLRLEEVDLRSPASEGGHGEDEYTTFVGLPASPPAGGSVSPPPALPSREPVAEASGEAALDGAGGSASTVFMPAAVGGGEGRTAAPASIPSGRLTEPRRPGRDTGARTPHPPVAVRRPRAPAPTAVQAPRRRLRRALGALAALAALGLVVAGGYLASQSVYFIGTDSRGLVTMYRGLPYQLPGGIKLYSSSYVSGVSAATLGPARRRSLLDHTWRSEADAGTLLRSLELEELSE